VFLFRSPVDRVDLPPTSPLTRISGFPSTMLARAAEINGDGIEGGGGGEGARRWEAVRRRPVDWTSIRLELEDGDVWDASN
jgi:hypothetical protein